MSSTGRKIAPILLVMIPILLLVGIGSLYTNFNDSGFATKVDSSTCTQLNCPAYLPTGCAQSSSNCSFSSGTSFSLISGNSPATMFLSGNILGWITALTSGSTNNVPSYTGVSFFSNCLSIPLNSTGNSITSFLCSSANEIGTGQTLPCFPYLLTSLGGNNSQFEAYSFYGPTIIKNNGCSGAVYPFNINANNILSYIAYNYSQIYSGYYINCVVQSTFCTQELWKNQTTGLTTTYIAFQFEVSASQTTQPVGTSINMPGFFSVLSFFLGIVLLFMALGIRVSASVQALATGIASTLAVNDQGSRLALIAGVMLIMWSFAYTGFGSWINLIGFGVGTAIYSVLTMSYLVGGWWMMHSYF